MKAVDGLPINFNVVAANASRSGLTGAAASTQVAKRDQTAKTEQRRRAENVAEETTASDAPLVETDAASKLSPDLPREEPRDKAGLLKHVDVRA